LTVRQPSFSVTGESRIRYQAIGSLAGPSSAPGCIF
jgi:hypothetical protein